MTDEVPENVAMERVFLIEATYAPDAADLRRPVRARHLARIVELRDRGIVLEAGGLLDMTASVLLVRAADEEAARELARSDIYVASGVWVEIRVRPFGRVCRPSELATA
jgi:hypothetical protein